MRITPAFLIISAFNFLIFSVPLYFRFENEELFEFNKMILVYALTVIIGFLWVFRMIVEKRLILKKSPLDLPILFFVFSQLLSTLFSIHPYTSWFGYYSRFNGGFLSTISYVVLFYAFISNIQKKDLSGFFLTAFISGTLVSLYGILEHFGHSFSCLLVPGNKSFDVNCWVQDVQSRVYATFGQPNWLAAYVITLFPIAFVASAQKKLSMLKRIMFSFTTICLFLVLLYTRSRSGILGFSVGLLTFGAGTIFLFLKNKKDSLKKNSLPTAGGIMLTVLLIALFNGTGLTPSIFDLFNASKAQLQADQVVSPADEQSGVNRLEVGGTDSGDIRKIVWTGAYKVWQRYPIIGSGVETFAYSYYQDRTREHNDVSEWDFLYNKAHNELLNLMATTGIIGLLTYLGIFAVLFGITLKIMSSPKHTYTEKLIVLALFAGQTSLFVSNFFGFSTVGVTVLMYLFFAITCVLYANDTEEKTEVKHSITQGPQYFGITLATIMSLFLLFRIYNYWSADVAYAQGKNYFNAGQYQYGIQKLLESIERSPNEALYYDTLSDNYAKLAAHFDSTGEATIAAQVADETVLISNQALTLNNRHLNFYKTRSRVMVTLSQLDEGYITEAKLTLLQAMELSPTDPKLVYTLGVIEHTNGNLDEGLKLYETAIDLKPNYERPYWKISEIYETQEKYEQAIEPLDYILENLSPNNEEALARKEMLNGIMIK